MLKQNENIVLTANKTKENNSDDPPGNLGQLEDAHWKLLIQRIRLGRCTPFIGGEACLGMTQFRAKIVQKWIQEHKDYPFTKTDEMPLGNTDDLPRAAQFVGIRLGDQDYPKEQVATAMKNAPPPDLEDPYNLYRVLAELPFPIYITTNYHNFMEQTLENLTNPKDVKMEFCRWNDTLKNPPPIFETESSFNPSVANPLVYHLYGHMNVAESLVLTEDDYFDFLIEVSENLNRIPPCIQSALTDTNLLFLGYRIFDWDFRILFRIVARYFRNRLYRGRRFHVAVQIETTEQAVSAEQKQLIKDYFSQYFEFFDIQVYWGSCHQFAAELRERWQ